MPQEVEDCRLFERSGLDAEIVQRHKQERGEQIGLGLHLAMGGIPRPHIPIAALNRAIADQTVMQVVAEFMSEGEVFAAW